MLMGGFYIQRIYINMKISSIRKPLTFVLLISGSTVLYANERDTIGHSDLIARVPGLDGSGLRVAQVEASESLTVERYQASPAAASQNSAKFSFFDTASRYPTSGVFDANKQSGHSDRVANNFYDTNTGLATDMSEILVFNANNFFNEIINGGPDINARVINQSFVFGDSVNNPLIEVLYDNYAANNNTLFVNGLNNGTNTVITPPASAYNGIAVGREDLNHSQGPTDGRSKPELIAPGSAASFATPYVAGSAALLMEAANSPLEQGGAGTASSASNYKTIKALLLNGAVKDFAWSHTDTQPLDSSRGAGLLNVNNSHLQLQGGKHSPTVSSSNRGSTSPVPSSTQSGNVSSLIGWNFSTITNTSVRSRVDNYYFDVPASTSALYDISATLVWERQAGQTDVNNLDLILYDVNTGLVVEQSISSVDNVEHIYKKDLPAGRYALQVFKVASGNVTSSEDYALAFNYSIPAPDAPTLLNAEVLSPTSIALTWTDNSNDELNFELQRSTLAGRAYSTIATLPANTISYTDSGLATNTRYYYRVKATNANGDSFYTNVADAIVFANDIAEWRYNQLGTTANTGAAANSADPDNDGLNNLTEYALGTDPDSAAGIDGALSQPRASVVNDGGVDYLQITINRALDRTDLDYLVEVSADLEPNWVETLEVLENTATTLRVRDNVAMNGNARRFIRLRVEEK